MSAGRFVVAIDHTETRIYKLDSDDGVAPVRITPYDPHNHLRHLHHKAGNFQGERAPENPSYYRRIAETLAGAAQILVIGHGTGASSTMAHLVRSLSQHHAEIADHIVGVMTADLSAATEPQLLAAAREFYAEQGEGA